MLIRSSHHSSPHSCCWPLSLPHITPTCCGAQRMEKSDNPFEGIKRIRIAFFEIYQVCLVLLSVSATLCMSRALKARPKHRGSLCLCLCHCSHPLQQLTRSISQEEIYDLLQEDPAKYSEGFASSECKTAGREKRHLDKCPAATASPACLDRTLPHQPPPHSQQGQIHLHSARCIL